jgi:hypothetical protein
MAGKKRKKAYRMTDRSGKTIFKPYRTEKR